MLALKIRNVIHPDDAECDWCQYRRILVSDIKSFSTGMRFVAHDAIVVLDLWGRILSWNGGAHRLFGRSPEETIGQESIRLLSEKETGQMRACLERRLPTGLSNRHLETLTPAGVKLEVQSSWRLLKSEGGGPQAFLIVETESGQTMPD